MRRRTGRTDTDRGALLVHSPDGVDAAQRDDVWDAVGVRVTGDVADRERAGALPAIGDGLEVGAAACRVGRLCRGRVRDARHVGAIRRTEDRSADLGRVRPYEHMTFVGAVDRRIGRSRGLRLSAACGHERAERPGEEGEGAEPNPRGDVHRAYLP